jgi:hypothetical protein
MPNVTIPSLGQYGVIADQPPQELPINAWTSCENVRFRGGNVERLGGHVSVFTAPSVTPLFVVPYQTQTKRFWIHCATNSVFADDGTTRSNITGTTPTGTAADRWNAAVLNGVLLLNNGVDSPSYWGGTGTLAALPGWSSSWKCKSIGAFKAFAVAVGITKSGTFYPHMVKWSDTADPGSVPSSWDEADATKLAGEVDLAETTDLIVDQLVLGDANLIYKERSIYAMRFIGGTQVFEFRRVPGSVGMLAKGCAAVTPKGHVVLANGDLVLVDGINEPQSLLADRLKTFLFSSQIDSAASQKCFVVSNPPRSEVWVCYPEVGETTCTRALVWNWESNTFGFRDLPSANHAASGLLEYTTGTSWTSDADTWNTDASLWNQDEFGPTEPRLIIASNAPGLYLADAGASFAGSAIPAHVERVGMAFDAPEQVKLLRSVVPRFDAPAGTQLLISAGGSMDAEQGASFGAPFAYTVGSSYKADVFATGRFLALRIESAGGARWRLKSMTLDVQPMGTY